jgi:hypothetical protein
MLKGVGRPLPALCLPGAATGPIPGSSGLDGSPLTAMVFYHMQWIEDS